MTRRIETVDDGKRTGKPPTRADLVRFLIERPTLCDEVIADVLVERRRRREAVRRIQERARVRQ